LHNTAEEADNAVLRIRNHFFSKVFVVVVNYAENATQRILFDVRSIRVKGNIEQFEKEVFLSGDGIECVEVALILQSWLGVDDGQTVADDEKGSALGMRIIHFFIYNEFVSQIRQKLSLSVEHCFDALHSA
jgi:hypothetical protein